MSARNIYIAIMVASTTGRGLNLTASEILELSYDNAIETHALNCLSEQEFKAVVDNRDPWPGYWPKIDPCAERIAFNGAV